MKDGMVFAGMGFELLGLILAALYIGGIIDNELNGGGLGVAGMVITVLVGWFVHLFMLLKKFMERADRDKKKPDNSPS